MELWVASRELVPEVRFDRNGKKVTRHVKPTLNSFAARNIPSVSKAGQERVTAKTERASDTEATRLALVKLSQNGVPVIHVSQAQHNVHYLVQNDPELMEKIIQAVCSGTEMERKVWTHELSFTPDRPADWKDGDTDYMEYYRISLLINPLASVIGDMQPESTSKVHFVRSLKYYVSEVAKANGRGDDALWMKAVMLTSHTASKGDLKYRNKWTFDTYKDDIAFLQENWKRVEPVIPLLVQRHDASRGFIEASWENRSSSLSEGLL